jgi:hypothetical protein
MTQDEFGCSVTPKWMISRLPWPITNQPYRSRNPAGGNDQEVYRGDLVPMILKECAPPLALITVGISLWESSGYGGKANEDSELLEFSLNFPSSPAVLVCESPNERLYLG